MTPDTIQTTTPPPSRPPIPNIPAKSPTSASPAAEAPQSPSMAALSQTPLPSHQPPRLPVRHPGRHIHIQQHSRRLHHRPLDRDRRVHKLEQPRTRFRSMSTTSTSTEHDAGTGNYTGTRRRKSRIPSLASVL